MCFRTDESVAVFIASPKLSGKRETNVRGVRAPIRRGRRPVEVIQRIVGCNAITAADARIFAKCLESNLKKRLP